MPSRVSESKDGAPDFSTPKTGEKRKRGRLRKTPEEQTPKPAEGPKRGPGRPRKAVSETGPAAAASEEPKRARGRPRKESASETPVKTPGKNGRGRSHKSLPTDPVGGSSITPKKGRGRPRKSLPGAASEAPVATPKTAGPGRPRKSLPAVASTASSETPKRSRGRPRKSLPAVTSETPSETQIPKRGSGRPRKSLPADTSEASSTIPKRGRGRPRKSLPADTSEASSTIPKRGRGRPRKSLPAEEPTDIVEPKTEIVASSDSKDPFGRSYWLMKAEPESRLEKGVDVKFSIEDLAAAKEPEPWDGVRNPVARNLMRDMKKGDYAFFYHSNCKVPGVVGVMEIVREHSVDESAFDPKHPYYDPKSSRENPKWVVVHVEFRRKLKKQVTLAELKAHAESGKPLENLRTLKQSRLSVSSVNPAEWKFILELAGEDS